MDPTRLDLDRIRRNVHAADSDDLLDRLTVYRREMEPEALELIEAELRARGVTTEQIDQHACRYEGRALLRADGSPATCSLCRRPAVEEGWGWHRLWGLLPIFPRRFFYCEWHRPGVHPRSPAAPR